jgi:D-alanine-D-alanine ligase
MASVQVLLLCGGGGEEHAVSLVSADFLASQLADLPNIDVIRVEIEKTNEWRDEKGRLCRLNLDKSLVCGDDKRVIDYVIPCLHGFPGETGDIQSLLTLANLPYLGCGAEASNLCFNKISSKLWFDALAIPNTPYLFLSDNESESIEKVEKAFDLWGEIFVKAASQGSSVGCYKITDKKEIAGTLVKAFDYSEQVLVEKAVKPRELEIAAYRYQGALIISPPGEIYCPEDTFYTFDEKYSQSSHSQTTLSPEGLTAAQIEKMQVYARKAFEQMKLKDLSRIDFFLTQDGEVFLNEINTFPGMTPISMFPKLLAHNGHVFSEFLLACINEGINN